VYRHFWDKLPKLLRQILELMEQNVPVVTVKICGASNVSGWSLVTRSSVITERPRDASCLSVCSFILRSQSVLLVTTDFGFRFTNA